MNDPTEFDQRTLDGHINIRSPIIKESLITAAKVAGSLNQSKVQRVLQTARIKLTKIAEIKVGNAVEPVFETSSGWVIGSYDALQKLRELNSQKWLGYHAHHIIETRHLELVPSLKANWLPGEMPAVLIPSYVHGGLYGDLSQLLSGKPQLNPGQRMVDSIFDTYEALYRHVRHDDELLAIVKKMLDL